MYSEKIKCPSLPQCVEKADEHLSFFESLCDAVSYAILPSD